MGKSNRSTHTQAKQAAAFSNRYPSLCGVSGLEAVYLTLKEHRRLQDRAFWEEVEEGWRESRKPPLGQRLPAGLTRAEAMIATWPAPLGRLSESQHFSYRAAVCGLLAGSK